MRRFKVQDWIGFAVAAGIFLLVSQHIHMRESGGRHPLSPEIQASVNRAHKLLDEGRQARRVGDLTTAEAKLRASIREDTSFNVPAAKELARVYEKEGRTQEAFAAYQQAFNASTHYYSDFPGDVEALTRYGLLCQQRGQWAEAARVYAQARDRFNPAPPRALAADFDPKVPQPSRLRAMLLIEHGLALSEMGKSQDALAAYKEAKRLAPEEPLTQFYGGAAGAAQPKAAQVALLKAAIQRAVAQ